MAKNPIGFSKQTIKKFVKQNGFKKLDEQIYHKVDNYYRTLSDSDLRPYITNYFFKGENDIVPSADIDKARDSFKNLTYLIQKSAYNPKYEVCLANGVYNVSNRTLNRGNTSNLIFTYSLPVKYDQNATCTEFQKFLDRSVPNKSSQKLLQEFAGYVLMPFDRGHQKALVLKGRGGNGKGTFEHVLKCLLGNNNFSCLPLSSFSNEKHRYMLKDKALNICSETSPIIKEGDFAMMKTMISFEEIIIKELYKDNIMYKPFAKYVFSTNTSLMFPDHGNALNRRILEVEFPNRFNDTNADLDLKNKLEKELSGILNWALEGYNRLKNNGSFTTNQSSSNKSRILAHTTIQEFFSSGETMFYGNIPPQNFTAIRNQLAYTGSSIYTEYTAFCGRNVINPVHENRFFKEISNYEGVFKYRNASNVMYFGFVFTSDKARSAIVKSL